MRLGIDIGSTTIKCVLFDEEENIIYQSYERHSSKVKEKLQELLETISKKFTVNKIKLAISGSAGMGTSERLAIPFIQEVYATRQAANHFLDKGSDVDLLFG